MSVNDASVRAGAKAFRWVIAIVFLIALLAVDRPVTLIGGVILGWLFEVVTRQTKAGIPTFDEAEVETPDRSSRIVAASKVNGTLPMRGSAWAPKGEAQPWGGGNGDAVPHHKALPPSLLKSGMWPPPEYAIDHGGGLSFTYADSNGEVTQRRIISWKEDPEYDHCFTGWCTDREEPRTFRIDRVQSWG